MKRVDPTPWLPTIWSQAHQTLARLILDFSTAINQAAEGRLRDFVDVTAAYTAGEGDLVIQVAPGGAMAVTLPAASAMKNKTVTVKRTNSTVHTITVSSAAGNIDGAASVTLTTAYQVRHFFSDGTAYWLH